MRSEFARGPAACLAFAALWGMAGLSAVGLSTAAVAQTPQGATNPADLRAVGKTRTCIDIGEVGASMRAGDSAMLFNTTGGRWYRSMTTNRCPVASGDDMLLIRNRQPAKYCAADTMDVVDGLTIVYIGTCTLGAFTPVDVPQGTEFQSGGQQSAYVPPSSPGQ